MIWDQLKGSLEPKQVTCFTGVVWEVGSQVRLADFLSQQIFFVQEEDGGGFLEPVIREDRLEQGQALTQSILKHETKVLKLKT